MSLPSPSLLRGLVVALLCGLWFWVEFLAADAFSTGTLRMMRLLFIGGLLIVVAIRSSRS